jgi:hypothetical protein
MSESGKKVSKADPGQHKTLEAVAVGDVRRFRTPEGRYKLSWVTGTGEPVPYDDYWACAKEGWISERGADRPLALTTTGQRTLDQARMALEAEQAKAAKKAEKSAEQVIS